MTNEWTSGGSKIDSSKWKNITSPYNEAERYFPIMNDRLIWRLWNPDIYLWSYGPYHNQAYDSRKFYLQTYSSTDLIKSSCDEKELFTSRIKCLKGWHTIDGSISEVFLTMQFRILRLLK